MYTVWWRPWPQALQLLGFRWGFISQTPVALKFAHIGDIVGPKPGSSCACVWWPALGVGLVGQAFLSHPDGSPTAGTVKSSDARRRRNMPKSNPDLLGTSADQVRSDFVNIFIDDCGLDYVCVSRATPKGPGVWDLPIMGCFYVLLLASEGFGLDACEVLRDSRPPL